MTNRFGVWSVVAALAVAAMSGQAFGDEKGDLGAASKKLSEAGSYSWVATTEGGFTRTPTEGKTVKDGATQVTFDFQEAKYVLILKGDKAAAKLDNAWKSKAEITKAAEEAGGFSPETIVSFRIAGFKLPDVQLKEMLEKAANVKKTAEGFTADLTPEVAKELLMFRRPAGAAAGTFPEVTVNGAKGDVKVWVKDGEITKMAVHLTGKRSFGDQENDVDQTTTTEIKEVGKTKVEVPEEATKKMG